MHLLRNTELLFTCVGHINVFASAGFSMDSR